MGLSGKDQAYQNNDHSYDKCCVLKCLWSGNQTEFRLGAVGLSVGVNMAILYTVYDETVNDRIQEAAKAPTPSPITTTKELTTTGTIPTTKTKITTTTMSTTTTTTTTLPTEPTPYVMNVDGLGEITGYLDGEFNDVVAFRVSFD